MNKPRFRGVFFCTSRNARPPLGRPLNNHITVYARRLGYFFFLLFFFFFAVFAFLAFFAMKPSKDCGDTSTCDSVLVMQDHSARNPRLSAVFDQNSGLSLLKMYLG